MAGQIFFLFQRAETTEFFPVQGVFLLNKQAESNEFWR